MSKRLYEVGQMVICIDDKGAEGSIKNGNKYRVIEEQSGCCGQELYFGERWPGPENGLYSMKCGRCNKWNILPNSKLFFRATRFAPIDPIKAEITADLLTEPVEERLDIHQPVTIITP